MAGWIVDLGATLAAGFVVGAVFIALGGSEDAAGPLTSATILVSWLLNTVVLVRITNGQSLGKLLAGMRLVREDGRRVGVLTGLLRDTFGRLIYLLPFGLLVDSLWAAGDKRQTLRDKLAMTRVIKQPPYRRRVPVVIVAAVLAVAAFGGAFAGYDAVDGEDTYSDFDRFRFVDGCTEEEDGWSEAECGCIYDHIAARVPYEDYRKADSAPLSEPPPPTFQREFDVALGRCVTG